MVSDDEQQPEDPPRKRIRVPVGRPDMFGEYTESLTVDEENAADWDSRVWHDRPPR